MHDKLHLYVISLPFNESLVSEKYNVVEHAGNLMVLEYTL